jgi:hypothetical protein
MRPYTAIALTLIALMGTGGCTSRIPIPDVSRLEREVEREIGSVPREVLDREENVRFWEIFSTDASVLADMEAESRRWLEESHPREVAEALEEASRSKGNADPVAVIRVDPDLLYAVAAQSDAYRAYELTSLADSMQTLHGVVNRRIEDVGWRVLSSAGRSDIVLRPDASVGVNASVPIRFGSRKIFVGPELALIAGSDDELACVIGHELAHITEGHTTSDAWVNLGKDVLEVTAAMAMAFAIAYSKDGQALTQSEIEAAIHTGQLASFLLADVPLRLSGWGRGQEREADAVGLHFSGREMPLAAVRRYG